LAKPNYSFEKRQRELAKKNKKEEKEKLKAQRKAGLLPADDAAPDEAEGSDAGEGAPPAEPPKP
jgi:hypothetical protein